VKSPSRVKVNVKESLYTHPPKKKKPQSKRQKNVFSFVLACFLKPKQTVSSNYTYPTWEAPQTLIHFHKAYIAVAAWQKPTVMDNK
jgi:hypothetical protein